MKNIEEGTNYFVEEIEQNELISKKHKKFFTTLNFNDHFLVLTSAVTRCVLTSPFDSLVGVPIGITSFEIELKICAITTEIKNYKWIIKKKENTHNKKVF